ncbi:MAG TPA: hypothetical protein VK826_06600 [Bacteroidia bacterium]|nr:hypothetical protein [Bacteroidia bacterium]
MSQLYVASSIALWDSQQANAAFMDASEKVMLAGSSTAGGKTSATAIQFNGKVLWANQYPGNFTTLFTGMTQLTDGTYIAVGGIFTSGSSGDENIWVVNIDANGKKIWEQQFNTPGAQSSGSSVTATADGGFVVVGWVVQASGLSTRIIRFAGNRQVKWDITQPKIACFSIAPASGGNFILSGRIPAQGLNSNPVALLIDGNGKVLFNTTFSAFSLYVLANTSAIQTADGNFVMVAKTTIFKFDKTGKVLWSNATANGSFASIAELSTGNLAIGGSIVVGNTGAAYVVVTDNGGNNIIWDNTEVTIPSNFAQVFIDKGYDVVWTAGSAPINLENAQIIFAAFNPARTLVAGKAMELSANYK